MASHPLRYLALGDSYTIGESVDPELRWPAQLAALLIGKGMPVVGPAVLARTGWTTGDLMKEIEEAELKGPFGLVSLLIGVNNQYRGRSLQEYRAHFRSLLHRAIDYAGGIPGRVLVLSMPDWGSTPFAAERDRETISRGVDAFNEASRAESRSGGVGYLDVTGISRRAAADLTLVAEDGLHPSGAMYALWARAAVPLALRALQAELRLKEKEKGKKEGSHERLG